MCQCRGWDGKRPDCDARETCCAIVEMGLSVRRRLLITVLLRNQLEYRDELKSLRCRGHTYSTAIHHTDNNMFWLQARKLCKPFSPLSLNKTKTKQMYVRMHPFISSSVLVSDDSLVPIL